MPRRLVVFISLAVVLAAVFVRLGFWQLSRLKERRAQNAVIAARMAEVEVSWDSLDRADSVRLRRTVVTGTPDTSAEFAILGRSRDGSPGVWIITPLHVAGSDEAVLVNRGWVYSPDAATVDLTRWREHRASYHGYLQSIPDSGVAAVKGRGLRTLNIAGVDSLLPYAFAPLYLVARDSGSVDSIPARLPFPVLNNGPHLSYAIQWFCFALTAVVGAGIVARRKG